VTVLVLDGNENQAVASVRSLARAGHHVVVGAGTAWSKAGWSRGCRRVFRYPSPQQDAAAFVAAVAAEAARVPGTLVLPMTERTTLPLSAERDRIAAAGGRLVLPPHATVLRAFDKDETTRLAASLGVDTPASVVITSAAEARAAAPSLRFPVVLKPRSSQELAPDGRVRTTGAPVYARDVDGFLEAWRDIETRCRAAIVQEFVPGQGVGYFALMCRGERRAEFAHRRLRDVRPTGSGSSLRESILAPPPVLDAGRAILRALDWHGPAMVEFRVRPDGTAVFLEVNGRFWNSLALAVYAGVDFPALTADIAERGDVSPATRYEVGLRCRWLLGDVRHLVEVWRGAPAGFPGRFPSRLRTLAAMLTPVPGTRHDNFSWRDPLPEAGDWLDFAFRRIPGRAAAGRAAGVWDAQRRASHP
jgi:predicted ATP-grasp superfamily ATP-dependent carboligase